MFTKYSYKHLQDILYNFQNILYSIKFLFQKIKIRNQKIFFGFKNSKIQRIQDYVL